MDNYSLKIKNALRARDLPTDGWYCDEVEDYEDDTFVCEICGCTKVRFIHVMRNFNTTDELRVGCICAGAIEDDMEGAKEREREMKNRASRKSCFPNRNWKTTRNGGWYLDHKNSRIFINKSRSGSYRVNCAGDVTWLYRGQVIRDFATACFAAFDMAEGTVS